MSKFFLISTIGFSTLFISCTNPRTTFEKNLNSWKGKSISDYIKANGTPRKIEKIPHRHDVYKFGATKVVSWIETRNPQVITTTYGGNSTTSAYGSIYGGSNSASGTVTSNTYVSPQTTVTTVIPGSSQRVSEYVGCEVWLYVRNEIIFECGYQGNCY